MSNSNKDKTEKATNADILSKLDEFWNIGIQHYSRDQRRMRMLDMTDNGDRWRAIGSNFEPYQILPDTNGVSYVKDNILASLYTTARSAEILPTSEEDKELCVNLNLFIQNLWETENVGYKMFQAGERAALLNLGITQVGWEEDFCKENKEAAKVQKGRVLFKNINPMHFMRDPFAESLKFGGWCCTFERFHKYVLKNDKRYSEAFKEYCAKEKAGSEELIPGYGRYNEVSPDKNYYNVIQWFIRTPEGNIDEIHTIDRKVILYKKENIQPSRFPFVELYCNTPSPSSLVGISAPAKIFANDTAYNFTNSLALTSEYKNQRPPKFVNAACGLNVASFTKHGAEADRTFIVNGDADRAVHYHQFPTMSPNVPNLLQQLQTDIQSISGVDGRYTGRDTGSIITTGGTEEMLNRVTMIDTPKIVNYEKYAKELTELTLMYLIKYSPNREVFVKKPNSKEYQTVEIKFQELDEHALFNYAISISAELPKNKQRIAAWADMIMEKQMQYRENGGNVELLTEEEWLMFQDIPFKEMLLERMGIERNIDDLGTATQVVLQYANLVGQGASPDDAIKMVADTLGKTRTGETLDEAEAATMMPAPPNEQVPMPMAQ